MAQKFLLFRKNPLLFNVVSKTEEVVTSDQWTRTHPGTVVFRPQSNSLSLIDCHFFLRMVFRVMKGARKNLEPTDNVAIANNFLCSAFSDVQLFINNVLVESSNFWPHKSYIKLLLSTSDAYKKGVLSTCNGWEQDTAFFYDMTEPMNEGYQARRDRVSGSKVVEAVRSAFGEKGKKEFRWSLFSEKFHWTSPLPRR